MHLHDVAQDPLSIRYQRRFRQPMACAVALSERDTMMAPGTEPSVIEDASVRLARCCRRLGELTRVARQARRWSVGRLAEAAGLSRSAVVKIEAGRPAGLLTYHRIAEVLQLDLTIDMVAPVIRRDAEDAVHAAMGEVLARRFGAAHREVLIDEPYQHFQFAGRGDLVVVDRHRLAFGHTEHKTSLPNIGEAAGSFNAKCTWLAEEVGRRRGIGRFASESHTLVLLWSVEIMEVVRRRTSTFRALGPDGSTPFEAWWSGAPLPGRHRGLVLFDPVDRGPAVRRWVDLDTALDLRPRYRGYADAGDELQAAGLA